VPWNPTASTFPPKVNRAIAEWLMAPGAGEELTALEDWLSRPVWHQDAACRGQGSGPWFSRSPTNLTHARSICSGCRVRAECYSYSMSVPDLEGVWAGLTKAERRDLRRQRVA
jgi:transcription factor WhiB